MSGIAVIDVVVPSPVVIDVVTVQGAPGPAGPAGAPGPPGPQGEPGEPGQAGAHAATHEKGGADPIDQLGALGVDTLRLPNGGAITARNAANTGDLNVITTNAINYTVIGDNASPVTQFGSTWVEASNVSVGGMANITGHVAVGTNPAQSGELRIPMPGRMVARHPANADMTVIQAHADGGIYIGDAWTGRVQCQSGAGSVTLAAFGDKNTFSGSVAIGTYVTLKESAAPAAPGADGANLWLQDNGAGKSQLMIQFATGAPIAIATQA